MIKLSPKFRIREEVMCKVSNRLFFVALVVVSVIPLLSIAQTTSTSTQLSVTQVMPTSTDTIILNQKVDLLEDINKKILNSVYWTLGILATIFLGIISVNLYFNISANKREIRKIKEEVLDVTKNLVKSAEADITEKVSTVSRKENEKIKREILGVTKNLVKSTEGSITDKISTASQKEIEKGIENTSNILKNQILNYRTEITEQINAMEKSVLASSSGVQGLLKKVEEIEISVKELNAFKYSQQGKLGGIINQIELLEYDVKNRSWNLGFRLNDIKDEVKKSYLTPALDQKLRGLLSSLKDKSEFKTIIEEIEKSITLYAAAS